MTTEFYLSRARLRRNASVGALAPLLLGEEDRKEKTRQPGHHLVWSLFADDGRRKRDFLWREMNQLGAFMILSARTPMDRHELFEIDEPKLFAPNLTGGDRLRFSLRANPVIRRRDQKRSYSVKHDVVMDALRILPTGQRAEKRLDIVRERGMAWLEAQATKGGFLVDSHDVAIDSYRQHRIRRNGGASALTFSTLDFDGVLEVTDPSAFQAGLVHGFGASKAYGCGLMLIRRA